MKHLGFKPYECMQETIKEINSRTGHYDENLKKFVKDVGFYTAEEVENYIANEFKDYKDVVVFELKYDTSKFVAEYIDINDNLRLEGFKRWYKADYESCKI